MSTKFKDYTPGIRQAGAPQSKFQSSAQECIKPQENRAETPEHIKKYRQSYKQQSGVAILHYGQVDNQVSKDKKFGISTRASQHASDCLKQNNIDGVQGLVNNLKEQQYASSKREPLGQRMDYGYKLPEQTTSEGFHFGAPIKQNDYTGKQVLFPQSNPKESEDIHKLYVKTHGNYEAGEQKNREYQWKIDPTDYRFGKKIIPLPDEIKKILCQDQAPDEFPKTVIVNKKQEDFKEYRQDKLGQPKNLAQLNPNITQETVFGQRKKQKEEEWNAGQCLKGIPEVGKVEPDKDLGKTNKFGFRNIPKTGDETKSFGVPTIRDDIKKKGQKSVADPNNYGDEKPAVALLFPQKYDYLGVGQQDFLAKRPKQEVKEIFKNIGQVIEDDIFDQIYLKAQQLEGGDDKVSVMALAHALAQTQ